jgi:hypothetical protein
MRDIAVVRQELAKHPEVSMTWFEWTLEDDHKLKTLVVEVKFDTDPTSTRPLWMKFERSSATHCRRRRPCR